MVSVTTNFSCFGTAIAQQPLVPAAASATAGSMAGNDSGRNGSSSEQGPPVAYLPAPGDHLLTYRGKLMMISRRRTAGNPQLAANARLLLETMTISFLGTDRSPLDALLTEAAAAYNHSQASRTAVHSVDQDGYWTQVGSRPIRPLSSVVLPEGQAEALLADCQEFLDSEQWYAHHGIPYRRGYLLYGPPGTGKTSLVMALAGSLLLEIYVVTLSSPSMTDEGLRHLLNSAGARSILLLEDVDAAFVDRSAGGGGAARLTFSGLLNAIDGVAAQEGRLLFMTTNHIERLSNALIRPGRVDVRCLLGPATQQQAQDLFVSFYRDLPHLLLLPNGTNQSLAGTANVIKAAAAPIMEVGYNQPAAGAGSAAEEADPSLFGNGHQGKGAHPTADDQSKQARPCTRRAAETTPLTNTPGSQSSPLLYTAVSRDRQRLLQELAADFASQLPLHSKLSMAQLQGYLMMHRKDPYAAVHDVHQLHHQQQHQQQDDQHATAATRAHDLDRLTTVGEQQPYYILECGQQRSRSKTCLRDGCNPVWNSAHKFSLSIEEAALVIIKDEVTKGIIGQGVIDLARARQVGKDDGMAPLMNMGGSPAGSVRAIVGGSRLSSEDLLAMYGSSSTGQLSGAGLGPQGDLVLQLQQALEAAHSEKLAAEEELSSMKQAMATMSREHFLDMKRLKDATPGHSSPGGTPVSGMMSMIDVKSKRHSRDSKDESPWNGAHSRGSSAHGAPAGVAALLAGAAGAGALAGRARGSRPGHHDDYGGAEAEGADGTSPSGSPMPAYKLRIQVHQLERQLAEQAAKLQEAATKQDAQVQRTQDLESQLASMRAALRQAEANTRAADEKAAEQATQAAAARAEAAAALAHGATSSNKEASVVTELAEVKRVLQGTLAEKAELEEALGLMERNNAASVATLQGELARAAEESAALRQGNTEVAALQAQLAAAQEEANKLRNNSEEVEYLQAQLRRTLRQVVELQHQVQVLNAASHQGASGNDADEAAVDSAFQSEHEFLMQELVATKLELAQLKEAQLVTQRQLYKAQQGMHFPAVKDNL
eukprot:gene13700-13822_t